MSSRTFNLLASRALENARLNFLTALVLALSVVLAPEAIASDLQTKIETQSKNPNATDTQQFEAVQVTATRIPRSRHSTAASITVIKAEDASRDKAGVALSEMLSSVPGVLARQRQNLAQDEQISIRGFGTRASFGLRGVRLYVDGLPATMPDGQGQTSHFPLTSAERIEVLRGPFSALYGNASGGVISLFTPDGVGPTKVEASLAIGSFGLRRANASIEGNAGERGGFFVSANTLDIEGWRRHSSANRNSLYAKWHTQLGSGELTLIANAFRMPRAEDPQGLTWDDARSDPRQSSAGAARFNTRKSVSQDQLGAVYDLTRGNDAFRVLLYGGRRSIEQTLSTPEFAQSSPLSAGGWIDLDSPFSGLDARWMAVRGDIEWVAGVSIEQQRQHRRGFENFVGTAVGIKGALRLEQDDAVKSTDPYLQATWHFAKHWRLSAGVRHSRIKFESEDRYVTAANPDDSGSVEYSATLPVVGLSWQPIKGLSFFMAAGKGFETPTFNELAYRNDGGSGPNFRLRPMRTQSVEAGMRINRASGFQAEISAFRTDTKDELAVGSSSGGRSTFQNAGRATRSGLEAGFAWPLTARLNLTGTATWMRARFSDTFDSCAGSGCTSTPSITPGSSVPGVPDRQGRLSLRYGESQGWQTQLEARYMDGVSVNAQTDERAPSYALFDASIGYAFRSDAFKGRIFLGIDNLADRFHIGSVIVNDSNGRYYEPGPGRTWLIGIELK